MSRGALDLLRRVALRVLVAVLVAVILSALGASAGRAAVPDSIVRNAPQVTNYLYRGGGTSTIPGCGGVCSDLWLAEHRPIPGQPASRALWSELTNLRTASGVLPRLGLIGTASAVVAGAGAFTVGWQIGTAIRGIFIEGEMPAAPAVPDQIDYFFAKDFARGATYGNVVITQPGYYVGGRIHNTSRDTYEYLDVAMPGPECPRASPGDVRPPFGSPMPNLATGNFVCVLQTATSPPVTRPTMMFRTNLQTKPAVDIADAPSVGRLYTANTIPDPGAANVQSRMLDELDRYPGQYPN
ncbi:MAG: hypothetical protein ACJ76L_15360, partial [Conexibacter sp.]